MSKNPSTPAEIQAKIKKLEKKRDTETTHPAQHPNKEKAGNPITDKDKEGITKAIEGLKKKLAKAHLAPSHAGSHGATSYALSTAHSEFGASASQAGHGTAGKPQNKITATNKTWAMIPPPMLDADACRFLGSKMNQKLWAYESCMMERATRTFYVKFGGHSYIAYLPFGEGLSMEHSALKTKITNLIGTTTGYMYHSDVYEYKEGDVKKHGFITFMIPFVYKVIASDKVGDYVCAVHPVDHTVSEIKSTQDLFTKYQSHIFASSIPDNSDITDLERLAKHLHDLTNSRVEGELYRTDNGLSDHVVSSHINLKGDKKLCIQIAIAYSNKEIAESASKLVKSIISGMRKMVNMKVWRRAMSASMNEEFNASTWADKHLQPTYTKLWQCTVWLLAKELCLQTMSIGRTVEMTRIFNTFVNTYVGSGAHPTRLVLKASYDYRQPSLMIPHMEHKEPEQGSPRNVDNFDHLFGGPGKKSELRNW